jgi:hypothetical protein
MQCVGDNGISHDVSTAKWQEICYSVAMVTELIKMHCDKFRRYGVSISNLKINDNIIIVTLLLGQHDNKFVTLLLWQPMYF